MTIKDRKVIIAALANGGVIEGMVFLVIYVYKSINGETLFSMFTDPMYDDMHISPYVQDVICLMANGILTIEGQQFLGTCDFLISQEITNRKLTWKAI